MPTTLDRFLPEFDQHEVHSRWINADPASVWTAVHEVTADEVPLARMLMRVRRPNQARMAGPLLQRRSALRLLAQTEGTEIVRGMVTQAWRPTPRIRNLADLQEGFAAFSEPGWIKVGLDIRVAAERGGTRLTTETRCKATDATAGAVFRMYWMLIRAGSGLIRRESLAAIARRAERVSHSSDRRPRP